MRGQVNHNIPNSPYEKIGTDSFEIDNTRYLITVHYYSKHPEIHPFTNTSSKAIIKSLKENFVLWSPWTSPQYQSDE